MLRVCYFRNAYREAIINHHDLPAGDPYALGHYIDRFGDCPVEFHYSTFTQF